MDATLMGMETEFGFMVYSPAGERLANDEWEARLIEVVKENRPSLRGKAPHDVYLGCGSRLYLDCGHPEWSTPEVTSPSEAVRYSRAGEATLLEAATELETSTARLERAILFKCNVDYAAGTTWGAHENYLMATRHPAELPGQIIPHMVSRIVFTGAGGLNPLSPGIEFSLSPRVAHLDAVASNRHAIFNTRDEPLAAHGYRRLHIVAGESLCSQLADYLRLGTTALVVKLCDAGFRPNAGISLSQPLETMRAFAADPACSVRAAEQNGCSISALDIQRSYLEQVESHRGSSFMPAWADEVCARWRQALDTLEREPTAMDTVLDWRIKLALFKHRARLRGIDWDAIPAWSAVQNCMVIIQNPTERLPHDWKELASLARTAGCPTDVVDALVEQARVRSQSPPELWESYLALRAELCEIDIRFGQLGSQGLFTTMDRAGVLSHRIVTDEEITTASRTPPSAGRGRVRGDQIRRLKQRRLEGVCDWTRIVDSSSGRVLDLSDPFQHDAPEWKPPERKEELTEVGEIFHTMPSFLRRRHRQPSSGEDDWRLVRGRDA